MLAIGNRAVAYVLSRQPWSIPRYVRLGKFMSKARLDVAEVTYQEEERIDQVVPFLLNPADLPAEMPPRSFDLVSVPQGLLARPLVSAAVAGWLLGDLETGLRVGALLELFALDVARGRHRHRRRAGGAAHAAGRPARLGRAAVDLGAGPHRPPLRGAPAPVGMVHRSSSSRERTWTPPACAPSWTIPRRWRRSRPSSARTRSAAQTAAPRRIDSIRAASPRAASAGSLPASCTTLRASRPSQVLAATKSGWCAMGQSANEISRTLTTAGFRHRARAADVIMAVIRTAFVLKQLPIYMQTITIGVVIIIAVALDQLRKRNS